MPDEALKRLAQLSNPSENGRWIIAALEGVQEETVQGRYDPGWFHPSDLSHQCEAFLAFRYLGAPGAQHIPARTRRIWDLGEERDVKLRHDMGRSGISLLRSLEDDPDGTDRLIELPELHIHGELDDIVKHPMTGRTYVIDYKTMKQELWDQLEVVSPGYHVQVHPYMAAKGTRQAYIIYENKNTQEFKIKKADWSDAIWAEITGKVQRVLLGLENNYVNRNPIECPRCPFNANGVCVANDISGLKARSGLWPNTSSTPNSSRSPEPSSSSPLVSSPTTAENTTPRAPLLI